MEREYYVVLTTMLDTDIEYEKQTSFMIINFDDTDQ